MNDANPLLPHQCLELKTVSGFLFVHFLYEDWAHVLNGTEIGGVSWPWNQNSNVLFTEPLGYYFFLATWCKINGKKALFRSKLLLDGWEKLLLVDILIPLLIHEWMNDLTHEWSQNASLLVWRMNRESTSLTVWRGLHQREYLFPSLHQFELVIYFR